MNTHTLEKLQYQKIQEKIQEFCTSGLGKELAIKIKPLTNFNQIKQKLSETTEARNILDAFGNFGLSGTKNIAEIITYVEKDGILNINQIVQVLYFLNGTVKVKKFMTDKDFYAPYLCMLAEGIIDQKEMILEIDEKIDNKKIADNASSELKSIRRQMAIAESRIKERLDSFLRNKTNEPHIQEFFISKRNGRQTVPIKLSSKNQIDGTVIDSNKKTAFIEPAVVRKLTDQLTILENDEEQED